MSFHSYRWACKWKIVGCVVLVMLTLLGLYAPNDVVLPTRTSYEVGVGRSKTNTLDVLDRQLDNRAELIVNSVAQVGKSTLRRLLRDVPDVAMGNERLVAALRQMLVLPGGGKSIRRTSRAVINTKQSQQVLKYFNKKKAGSFVEVGALDGERSSNSLFLESRFGWTGLLIEMDRYFFLQALGKNRQAKLMNACLSLNKQVNKMKMSHEGGGSGKLDSKSANKSADSKSADDDPDSLLCAPLYSILLAAGLGKLDFLSLDVEGHELLVLQTLPWQLVDIEMMTVEYNHIPGGKDVLISYMKSVGYRVFDEINYDNIQLANFSHDIVFVKEKANNNDNDTHDTRQTLREGKNGRPRKDRNNWIYTTGNK